MPEIPNELAKAEAASLRQIMNAWLCRHETKAAKETGSLMFWRDGMLQQLRQIAKGEATEATFKFLTQEFDDTQEPVARSIQKLKDVREKLGANPISTQIDIILNDPRFGKNTVRDNIESIIAHRRETDMKDTAKWVCDAVETLNAEIKKLHRMVNPG